ncbi:prephenate dehydrogenase [Corynebacterium sp. H78]|uniref:prephenate dehydrogenase n=1 Tax=Corynebacterium sp. H78 TaxID=3133417 RepID=UPI0030A601B1
MTTQLTSTPICILGLGLIGGSMLRDLKDAGHPAFGWNRSSETVDAAVSEGYDASADLDATLQRAQDEKALIVIGTPMTVVGRMLDAIAEHAPDCGITDVVSVKTAVLDAVREHNMQYRYVGAHPMAGSAKSGWDATVTGLFDGAPWVITYDLAEEMADTDPEAELPESWLQTFRDVVSLGTRLGSEIVPARSLAHDQAVAKISHMPHLVAYAVAVTGDAGGQLPMSLAAGSFRDGTRVAAAEPDMVLSWCDNNVEPVLGALDEVIELLTDARTELTTDGTATRLSQAGFDARTRFEARTGMRPVIRVSLNDDNWLDQLRHAESIGGRIDVFENT